MLLPTAWLQSPPVVRSSVRTVRGLPVCGSLRKQSLPHVTCKIPLQLIMCMCMQTYDMSCE